MTSVMSAIKNTVPITQFNRGLAGKIFEEVKQTGAKVVMKITRQNAFCFRRRNMYG